MVRQYANCSQPIFCYINVLYFQFRKVIIPDWLYQKFKRVKSKKSSKSLENRTPEISQDEIKRHSQIIMNNELPMTILKKSQTVCGSIINSTTAVTTMTNSSNYGGSCCKYLSYKFILLV